MSRTSNAPLLLTLVVCILAVAGAMIAAVFLAGQKPVVVVVIPQTPTAAEAAPAGVAAAAAGPATPVARPPEVIAARLAAVPALDDVFDSAWAKVAAVDVPLQPQQTAPPMLAVASVQTMTVQAARDDKRIAWRLSWPATQPAATVETGQFSDAVAIQVPMVDGAPFTMGGKGMPVRVLHWKAVWQRDIDKGFQDVQDLYPNSWTDLYWFTPSPGNSRLDKAFQDPRARQYIPALAAGNPMAQFDRKIPLEEIVAEGFGTATHVPDSPSHARGVWKDGRWTVVMDRSLDPKDPLAARLQSAGANVISFAVWDGSSGNRGGQKHYCNWIALKLEP
jgi:hypothetical protein